MQSYLATRDSVLAAPDQVDLDEKSAARARFVLMQLTEALAPTNSLLTNPAAIKKAAATKGRSLVAGGRHLAHDVRRNGGLPSQVDTRPFVIGATIAVTPGSVVYTCDQFELIQYKPTTARVAERPVLIVPPQINRFYFLDLAPGRSFAEHAVSQGLQVFMVSWRNPGREQRSWGLDIYVQACLDAIKVANEITRSERCNVIGFCAGGLTLASLLGHLGAIGSDVVGAATLAVAGIDTEARSAINLFASRRSVASSIARSRRKGVLDGRSLSRTFAWVRPNDLVWNYWVNNYLMGENPPAFDVLAWNSDATNLPAALHADFLNLVVTNGFLHPGSFSVLGSPVDLGLAKNDMYVVGAITDHLVPWESTYMATQVFGGETRYVLSNSGHIQALVNPPGNAKASYLVGVDNPPDPEEWRARADVHKGSWWTDWAAWIAPRSGDDRPAPRKLGSRRHPPQMPAPGRYVHQQP
jgi:polyhydroxyalkanoate synthase